MTTGLPGAAARRAVREAGGEVIPDRGVAVREAARAGARGRVVSVHRKAVYLRLDGALIALVSADVEPGPLHLRCDRPPPAAVEEPVGCDGSRITARAWAVRCDVPVWEGVLPTRGGPARVTGEPDGLADRPDRAGQDLRPGRDRRAGPAEEPGRNHRPAAAEITVPPDVPVDPEHLATAVRGGAIEELARLLGGRGPGLTPSGDDLLAGLVLAARALWGATAQARLVAAVRTVPTTEPSAAFLHWAARGQSLAPAHDVLAALADGDAAAVEHPARRLEAIGASSGRCLLAGLLAGVAQLPRLDTQSTRAGSSATFRACTR